MKYRYISDCHVHTRCSPDGSDPLMMMCDRAAGLGLHAITITDHCECNDYLTDGYIDSIKESYLESKKARAVYQNKVQVYSGVELGQPTQDLKVAEDILDAYDFDFVLASLHNIEGARDFYYLDYREWDVPVLLQNYFDQLLKIVEWGNFDSLAHLTYPLRYIMGEYGVEVECEAFLERIDTILRTLVLQDKALEINTSGLRQKYGKTLPDLSVVKRFRELGGRFVTLGSDAHRWADVGGGVEDGLDLLQEAGFRSFTIFVKREPRLFPLE